MEEVLNKLQEMIKNNLVDNIEKIGSSEKTSITIKTKDQIKNIVANKNNYSSCTFNVDGITCNGNLEIEYIVKELQSLAKSHL